MINIQNSINSRHVIVYNFSLKQLQNHLNPLTAPKMNHQIATLKAPTKKRYSIFSILYYHSSNTPCIYIIMQRNVSSVQSPSLSRCVTLSLLK
jgi:hypothetical protein